MRASLAVACIAMAIAGCAARPDGPPPRAGVADLQAAIAAARGRPLLVVFWATWCRPCVEEIPELAALHTDAEHGARVMAVSLDAFLAGDERAPKVVQEFLAHTPTPYTHHVYVGGQDAIVSAFGLSGSIPYAILYDPTGRELRRFDGRTAAQSVREALASSG